MSARHEAKNVLGGALEDCSTDPVTGWFRDGCCRSDEGDRGVHTVCIVATAEFLSFSASVGNDLSTPMPGFQFPGLRPGDHWCLCAARWLQAYEVDAAPKVRLAATDEKTLEIVPLEALLEHGVDLH